MEIFPARTPTLPPATHTNSYALGGRELILVEPATPYEDERREWLAWARGFASQGRMLTSIVVTHHHADHVGGAAFFARELGLQVWAHLETATRMRDVPVARRLKDGDVIVLGNAVPTAFRVLHTPGHAAGHICLFDEVQGTIIVGDMVASVGSILIDPRDGDMTTYLAQLHRLAALRTRLALPAHGEPIESPAALFNRYIAHRLMRERQVELALSASGDTGARLEMLMPIAYGDTPALMWPVARLSLEAHLLKLERDGRAQRIEDRWRRPPLASP